MPLCIMLRRSYEERGGPLRDENAVLFYSDRLVEAHNPEGEMFGFQRLRAPVAKHVEERSPGNFLMEELYSFTGEG